MSEYKHTDGDAKNRLQQWIHLCEQSNATGEATEIMEEAIARIEALEAQLAEREWTSTSIPPKQEDAEVLLLYPDGHREFFVWMKGGTPFVHEYGYDEEEPTHYLVLGALPPPPIQQQGGGRMNE